jgi:hypothetical protein
VVDAAGNTNSCAFAVLVQPSSAPAFRILSILREGNNVRVSWSTPGGRTNQLQATTGHASGSFSNNFSDIDVPVIIEPYGDAITNRVEPGGATNQPARYYRVRLVP